MPNTRHKVVRLHPQPRCSSRLWSRISWVSGLSAPSSAVWSHSTYALHSSCQGHPDPCLWGPGRLSEINQIEETTRTSSHYLASSSYQWLLPHSNRSFAAGDWPFKMEIACYGHLGYASLMMMTCFRSAMTLHLHKCVVRFVSDTWISWWKCFLCCLPTRNSAIADRSRDAFRGQSRSSNMVPFNMLGMVHISVL